MYAISQKKLENRKMLAPSGRPKAGRRSGGEGRTRFIAAKSNTPRTEPCVRRRRVIPCRSTMLEHEYFVCFASDCLQLRHTRRVQPARNDARGAAGFTENGLQFCEALLVFFHASGDVHA